jgi:penicillin-insensitive murein endopeptidase
MRIARATAAAVFALVLLAPAVLAAVDDLPADLLFSQVSIPSQGAVKAIGSYAEGCLAGGVSLPPDGPHWQAMRPSRNRQWGTPQMISYIAKLSEDAAKDGWPGLLIGDISQPRGGPMPGDHLSHQTGLDADIWFNPMPNRVMSVDERETVSAASLLLPGKLALDPAKWAGAKYAALLKRAASYPEVARIFVSAAIKQNLCQTTTGDRAWLEKLRPWYGHDDHFHVRLLCPAGMASCIDQGPNPPGDGCGDDLAWWFKPMPPAPPQQPPYRLPTPVTLPDLPAACTGVITSGPGGLTPARLKIPTPLPHLRPSG